MKRIVALFLIFSLISLCACSGKEENNGQTTVQTTQAPDAFTEWNSDLLPANFPEPVPGMRKLKIENGTSDENGYGKAFVRISFTCSEKDIYLFSNSLAECGYVGGIKNISNSPGYLLNGFSGSWQDGKSIITLNKAELTDTGEYTFVFDIVECVESFPEALEPLFPKFKGYSIGKGDYYVLNEKGEIISQTFDGSLSDKNWSWNFNFTNGFAGVTLKQFTDYENALVEAGFVGNSTTSSIGGCSIITTDALKTIDGTVYGIFMVYNQTLKCLDVVFTNEPSLYLG